MPDHLHDFTGPNGSGKSTLAAAMAIGLGFPPKVSSHVALQVRASR